MYAAERDVEIVKRFGRCWTSSSFSLYPWETKEATKDLSQGMIQAEGKLEAANGLGAEVAAAQEQVRRGRFRL